jgi:DeoR/GlpR family transcriptional regulator of sugar metabolism
MHIQDDTRKYMQGQVRGFVFMQNGILLKEERHQHILEALHRQGKIVAIELAQSLEVSEDTIRRDLRELAEAGKLQRVHGGALPRPPIVQSFTVRQQQQPEIKATLAKAAATLIQPDQVVLLYGGTTTLMLANSLPHELRTTIATNSPSVMLALAHYPQIEVVGLGGKFLKDALNTVGTETIEEIQRIRFDLCVLGACSLHVELGISLLNLDEAYVQRAAIANSAEVVAIAPADRLGTASPYIVGSLSLLTHLVTEASVSADILMPYKQIGISIIQA